MSHEVKLTPEAEIDIDAAWRWYESQKPYLGARFIRSYRDAIEKLERVAMSCPAVDGDRRRLRLKDFPYAVYFLVGSDVVHIVSVTHVRRKPPEWQKGAGSCICDITTFGFEDAA